MSDRKNFENKELDKVNAELAFEKLISEMNAQPDSTYRPIEYEKRTYTVSEIQDILGISQPTAYGLIKKNLFKTVKVGRQIRISKKSFDAWLDDQE